jgi:hypothetical protein
MRRWIIAGLALAILVPTGALAISVGGNYHGAVKGDPDSSINFELKRTDSGKRRVTGFVAAQLDFTCEGGDPGQTSGVLLNRGFRVKRDRSFGGRADATILGFDPPARLRGKLRRHGRAVGTIRVHGEIDPQNQPAVDCDTGVQAWRAKRQPPIRP